MSDFWSLVGWAIFAYAVLNGLAVLYSGPAIDHEKVEKFSNALASAVQMELDKGFAERDARINDLERRIIELEAVK